MELKEINDQLQRLQRERQELVDREFEKVKEEFYRLDWLKDMIFYFDNLGGWIGASMFKYVLKANPTKLVEKVFMSDFGHKTLMGDSPNYQMNITINRAISGGGLVEINTNNTKLLTEFIKKYHLKFFSNNFAEESELYKTLAEHQE